MKLPGNLLTTAMAVMPHTDADRALQTALTMDVPFWPQLPNLNYREDMYVQAAEHFPGIELDILQKKLRFSMDRFVAEYEAMLAHDDDPDYFDVSRSYSSVYYRFLDMDLSDRPAIRGQLEGPVSFGFNILDQDERPILFDDTIRPFMYEFMAKRLNVQLSKLKRMNPNAFMFIDEPGMQFIFSALSGYSDMKAKEDLDAFLSSVERPRGIHLCGNPDWEFMLNLDLDILSMDIYTNREIFSSCAASIKRFIEKDGVIVWGIVPTGTENFDKEGLDRLVGQLESVWSILCKKGLSLEHILDRSMLSPATCCLVNPDGHVTVENAFKQVKDVAKRLKDKYFRDRGVY